MSPQRFIRDREFVAETHMALYLFALRNVVFALGPDVLVLSAPMYNDLVFLQKLLLLSRKKTSKLLAVRLRLCLFAMCSETGRADCVAMVGATGSCV